MALIPAGGGEISTYAPRTTDQVKSGTYFEEGDFLIAKITPSFENGKQAIATRVPGGWGLATTEVFAMRSKVLSSRYLALVFRHSVVREQLAGRMEGATGRMRLPRRALEDVVIPVAPAELQDEIARTVDDLFAAIQVGADAFAAAAATEESYEQSLLACGVTGGFTHHGGSDGKTLLEQILTTREEQARAIGVKVGSARPATVVPAGVRLPPSWVWATIDQLAIRVQYGTSAKANDDDAGVPVLRMGNIRFGRLTWDQLRYLPADHENFPAMLLNEGDVLFNRTNSAELVGKTALVKNLPRPASFASYLIRLVPHPLVEPAWISYWLNSPFGRRWAREQASQQTGQANINGAKLRQLAVPLPPINVQRDICLTMDASLDRARSTARQLELLAGTADGLRQAILTHALNGRLRRSTRFTRQTSLHSLVTCP